MMHEMINLIVVTLVIGFIAVTQVSDDRKTEVAVALVLVTALEVLLAIFMVVHSAA